MLKVSAAERAQAAMFSWIVDVYIQIPWPHRVTRSTLDFGSSSSSARVYYCSLSYARDLFQVLPTPFVVISTTNAATRCGHIWCDIKLRLRHTSRDERAQALCANFVLQATNAQGLGTRLPTHPLGSTKCKDNKECPIEFSSEEGLTSSLLLSLYIVFYPLICVTVDS